MRQNPAPNPPVHQHLHPPARHAECSQGTRPVVRRCRGRITSRRCFRAAWASPGFLPPRSALFGGLCPPRPRSAAPPGSPPPALGAWGAGGTCRGPSGRSTRRCPWKVPLEESFRRSTLLFSRYFWLRRVVPLPLSCRFGHGLSAMAMGLAFFLVKDKALHTNKSPPARRARPRPVACACLS